MNSIGSLTASGSTATSRLLASQGSEKLPGDLTAREAFQDFVAGTFFQQMLKSMRATQEKPAYFHGGQAEEMFQSQLDQQVAADLAKSHGASFSDQLFEVFSRQVQLKNSGVPDGHVVSAYDNARSTSPGSISSNTKTSGVSFEAA